VLSGQSTAAGQDHARSAQEQLVAMVVDVPSQLGWSMLYGHCKPSLSQAAPGIGVALAH
jgi:hypothetical protein